MKKLLLFVLCAITGYAFAQDSASQLNDWFDYLQDEHNAKLDLVKKQHGDIIDLKKQYINKYKTGGISVEDFFRTALKDLRALHKRHMEEWKKFGEDYRTKESTKFETGAAAATETEIPTPPSLPTAGAFGAATAAGAETTDMETE